MAKMTKVFKEKLDKDLSAFSLSMLQDFMTFKKHCKRQGIDENEVANYIKEIVIAEGTERRKQVELEAALFEKAPRCSVCKSAMMLEEINNRASRMIDDHSHSWWICPDPTCPGDPIVSDMYPYEVLSDLGIAVHKTMPAPTSLRRQKAAAKQRRLEP